MSDELGHRTTGTTDPGAGTSLVEAYRRASALMGPFADRTAPPQADQALPGALLCDDSWLADRVTDTGERWRCADRRVNGTLWWYSATATLLAAAPAMLLAVGTAPDPAPRRIRCSLTDFGYLGSARSDALLTGAEEFALALGPALERTIVPLARVSGASERALWAIASDSLANRALTAGTASGRVEEAGILARTIARAPLLPPRFVDVTRAERAPSPADPESAPPSEGRRIVRRSSCCLIYQAADNRKCVSCPRHRPDERADLLRDWLDRN